MNDFFIVSQPTQIPCLTGLGVHTEIMSEVNSSRISFVTFWIVGSGHLH